MRQVLLETKLKLPNRRQGKVRDLYDATLPSGEPGLLIIASDRISAFDVVLGNGLPGKGIVLTQISKFWFDFVSKDVTHHLVSTDTNDIQGLDDTERAALKGRVMLCRKTDVLPIECIARGYITGSGWKDYQRTGKVCGIDLPKGLKNGEELPHPLFTPSTKAATGHDENISFDEGGKLVGEELMSTLRDLTLSLYAKARDHARERGIILADTKFEFGLLPGEKKLLLIDEIFTPDSSRFWPADKWKPGGEQPSFDKQYVRDYLEQLVARGAWDKTAPGPKLPRDVIENTMQRYTQAYERLTGRAIDLESF